MKTRTLLIACCATGVALFAGCTSVYTNSSACEQAMRQSASEQTTDTLHILYTGSGIKGSRVVVEGTLEHPQTASEAAAAKPPETDIIKAGLLAPVAAAITNAKPKKTVVAAAVECTYNAGGLSEFRWLAPAKLAKTDDEADTDTSAK